MLRFAQKMRQKLTECVKSFFAKCRRRIKKAAKIAFGHQFIPEEVRLRERVLGIDRYP